MQKGKLFRFKRLGGKSATSLKADYYVFGLGNTGAKFHNTRHNAGFDVLDILAQKFDVKFSTPAFKGVCTKITSGGKLILLIKPQTYMNLSGECVSLFMKKLHIDIDSIIVVYDDIDLKKGALRIRSGGSAGTHNGLKSIIYHLQRDDFKRVRIGIGKPKNPDDLIPFVIGTYPKQEWEMMFKAYTAAGEAVLEIVTKGIASAQSLYNTKEAKKNDDV